jgi:hypothetical protein
MTKGRITVNFSDDEVITVSVYPKNEDNKMYGTILEYLLNSKKCQEQIKTKIFNQMAKVFKIEHKQTISNDTDNA